jgi:hypothetical protein
MDPGERTSPKTITGAIKQLFRPAAKAITGGEDEPQPQPKKRKSGETEKGFNMAARAATVSNGLVPDAYAAATGYLFATLDWLNPFHNAADNFAEIDNSFDNSHSSFPTLDL